MAVVRQSSPQIPAIEQQESQAIGNGGFLVLTRRSCACVVMMHLFGSTLGSPPVSSCLVAAAANDPALCKPAPVTNPRPASRPSTVVAALPIRARLL